MKKLLFITWDGPQTSYMEGLFMPISHEISKHESIQFQENFSLENHISELMKIYKK